MLAEDRPSDPETGVTAEERMFGMRPGLVFTRGWLLALVLVSKGSVLGAPSPTPSGRRQGGTGAEELTSPPAPSAVEGAKPGEKALAVRPWSRSGPVDPPGGEPLQGEKDGLRVEKSRSPRDIGETEPPAAGGTDFVPPGPREQRHRRRRNQGQFTQFPARNSGIKTRLVWPRKGEVPEADEDDQDDKSEGERRERDRSESSNWEHQFPGRAGAPQEERLRLLGGEAADLSWGAVSISYLRICQSVGRLGMDLQIVGFGTVYCGCRDYPFGSLVVAVLIVGWCLARWLRPQWRAGRTWSVQGDGSLSWVQRFRRPGRLPNTSNDHNKYTGFGLIRVDGTVPGCPKCGGEMHLRESRHKAGLFWGCVGYRGGVHHCDGTRELAVEARLQIAGAV